MKIKLYPQITTLIFDWGDTVMRDFPDLPGPMYLWEEVFWIPGAEKTLKELQPYFTLVIATNAGESDTQAMIKALKRVGADKYFSYFYSSKDLGYQKPDVRFFDKICEELKVKNSASMMIGNHYGKDIVGAKQSGMFTVLFDENNIQKEAPDADFVITKMENLISLILRQSI
jgi:putative hydrolase of the HAD superfamily